MKSDGMQALERMASNVRALPDAALRAAYRAANTVQSTIATEVRRDIARQLNLTQSYIADQMRTTKASATNTTATLRMRIRPIRLARFDGRQLTKPAPRARGDVRRGVGPGRKAAGASVKVSRAGGRKTMPGAFLLPLRAGKEAGGNGMGLFIREGSRGEQQARSIPGVKVGKNAWGGKLRHLYGPSPDQLFRRWIAENRPDITKRLARAYASQLRYELTGRRK